MLTASKQMFVTVKLSKFCFGSFLHRLVWEATPHIKSHRFAIAFIAALAILAAGSCASTTRAAFNGYCLVIIREIAG